MLLLAGRTVRRVTVLRGALFRSLAALPLLLRTLLTVLRARPLTLARRLAGGGVVLVLLRAVSFALTLLLLLSLAMRTLTTLFALLLALRAFALLLLLRLALPTLALLLLLRLALPTLALLLLLRLALRALALLLLLRLALRRLTVLLLLRTTLGLAFLLLGFLALTTGRGAHFRPSFSLGRSNGGAGQQRSRAYHEFCLDHLSLPGFLSPRGDAMAE